MKIIFLDFDGVLNSVQETVEKRLRLRWSLTARMRDKMGSWLLAICHLIWTDAWRKVAKFLGKRNPLVRLVESSERALANFALFGVADHAEFCPIACSNLQNLLDQNPDVNIVVSSTWRSGGLDQMKYILNRNHIDPSRVIGVTPRGPGQHPDGSPGNGDRGYQIQEWLNNELKAEENWAWYWDVEKFVILDDDADMVHLAPYHVHTDGYHGFTWRDMEKAVKILEGTMRSTEENKRLKRWGLLGMLTGRV